MATSDPSVEAAWRSFFGEHLAAEVRSFVGQYPAERSLYVDVFDLHRHDEGVVERLFEDPDDVLELGTDVLRAAYDDLGPVNLRLRNLPSQLGLGSVRSRHVSKLVSVDGVVDAVGPVEARARKAEFVCDACGAPERDHPRGMELRTPARCDACGTAGSMALDRDRSTFVDVQRVVLRDAEEDSSHTMAVFLDDDLVDTVKRGESLRVTGVVRLDPRPDENRFRFYVDGLTVDEQSPGPVEDDRDVDEQLKASIRSRWEFVVGE